MSVLRSFEVFPDYRMGYIRDRFDISLMVEGVGEYMGLNLISSEIVEMIYSSRQVKGLGRENSNLFFALSLDYGNLCYIPEIYRRLNHDGIPAVISESSKQICPDYVNPLLKGEPFVAMKERLNSSMDQVPNLPDETRKIEYTSIQRKRNIIYVFKKGISRLEMLMWACATISATHDLDYTTCSVVIPIRIYECSSRSYWDMFGKFDYVFLDNANKELLQNKSDAKRWQWPKRLWSGGSEDEIRRDLPCGFFKYGSSNLRRKEAAVPGAPESSEGEAAVPGAPETCGQESVISPVSNEIACKMKILESSEEYENQEIVEKLIDIVNCGKIHSITISKPGQIEFALDNGLEMCFRGLSIVLQLKQADDSYKPIF